MSQVVADILASLRDTDEPALSASKIAEEVDASVKTVNKHMADLVENGRVESTQIGNATAYFIPFDNLSNIEKPDYFCDKCGREVQKFKDFAKIRVDTYFDNEAIEYDDGSDFRILCRFCFTDIMAWLHYEDRELYEYPTVHSWNIDRGQLKEVREDPSVKTSPNRSLDFGRHWEEVLGYLQDEYDHDEWFEASDVCSEYPEMVDQKTLNALEKLHRNGYLDRDVDSYRLAK